MCLPELPWKETFEPPTPSFKSLSCTSHHVRLLQTLAEMGDGDMPGGSLLATMDIIRYCWGIFSLLCTVAESQFSSFVSDQTALAGTVGKVWERSGTEAGQGRADHEKGTQVDRIYFAQSASQQQKKLQTCVFMKCLRNANIACFQQFSILHMYCATTTPCANIPFYKTRLHVAVDFVSHVCVTKSGVGGYCYGTLACTASSTRLTFTVFFLRLVLGLAEVAMKYLFRVKNRTRMALRLQRTFR